MNMKGRMKRLLTGFLAMVVILTTALPEGFSLGMIRAYGETDESGVWEYNVLEDGTVEITGYNGKETELVVPAEIDGYSVSGIGDRAFSHYGNIISIEISEGLVSIGDEAFSFCSNLCSIYISKSVSNIGGEILIGNYMQSIIVDEENSVYDSRNDCNAIIDSSKNTLISGCKKTIIPEGVTSIGDYAFGYCWDLDNIDIPEGVTSISDYAFYACSNLVNIEMPNSVTTINCWAFGWCQSLVELELPMNIQYIGSDAFTYTQYYDTESNWTNGALYIDRCLVEVDDISGDFIINDDTRCIADGIFVGQSNLNRVEISEANEYYRTLDGVLFDKNMNSLIFCPIGKTGSYIVPDGVNRIENDAFRCCENIESIEISEEVTYIGERAFYMCNNISSIKIPNGVKSISDRMFELCLRLEDIEMPEELINIGEYAFATCSSLENIEIPEGVTSIGEGAFACCYALKEIKIPNNVKKIESCTFYACYSLTKVLLPDNLLSIEGDAFSFCNELDSIDIPESVVYIGSYAFSNCSSLEYIDMPGSISDIGAYAFYRCESLSEMKIPEGIKYISSHMFAECGSLLDIELPNSILTIGNESFFGCYSLKSIEIPENVSTIEDRAFQSCNSILEIHIPKNVKYIGSEVFGSCKILLKMTVADDKKVYDSRDNCNAIIETVNNKLISGCNNTVIPQGITTIGCGAFDGCENLKNIDIPEGVVDIESSAFCGCVNLEEIKLPESLLSIGDNAFLFCRALEEIELPESVASIGYGVFRECDSLKKINIPKGIKIINYETFKDCKNLTEINIPNGVTNIGIEAFYGCSSLSKINIPNSVISIDHGAFCCCYNLSEIEIPNSVTDIEYNTFFACENLKITIPDSVTYISDYAFRESDDVTIYSSYDSYAHTYAIEKNIMWRMLGSVVSEDWNYRILEDGTAEILSYLGDEFVVEIPTEFENGISVVSIGDAAFKNNVIEKVIIPEGITTIGWGAFKNCYELTNVTIPSTVVNIGEYAFCNCDSLVEVVIEDGVKSIDYDAFSDCYFLTKITIPSSVTNIGDGAFSGCYDITICCSPDSYAYNYAIEYGYNWELMKLIVISGNDMVLDTNNYIYDGTPHQPTITVKNGEETLTNGTDYTVSYSNNINVGTATVTITGKGDYTGTVTKTFTINPAAITDALLDVSTYTYDGKAKIPTVTVKSNQKFLKNGVDYDVKYTNNVNAGTASVSIIGKGNYTGTITKTFIIKEPEKQAVSETPKEEKISAVQSLKQKATYATNAITLNWKKVEDATGYEVYRANSKNGKYTKITTTTKKSYKNNKLKAGKTYYYKVRAYKDANGTKVYGDYSVIKSMITKCVSPSIKLKAGKKQVKITWSKVTGANGYEVYMSASKSGKYTKIKTTSAKATSFTKKKLTKGKKYFFKARTYKTVNGKKVYSVWSKVKSVKVK